MEPAKKKWKRSYENSRLYNPKWEKEFSWLSKNSNGDAYCKVCHCSVAPKHTNIKQHEHSVKHKSKAPAHLQKKLEVISTPRVPKVQKLLNTTTMEEEQEQEQSLPAIEKQELMEADTYEDFLAVFGDKSEFDSWDEFTVLLEEFQKKTGSSFKPRSASSVDYANERRINGPIPERFVYANVKMICVHFGLPSKRAGGNRRSYIGRGCGAFMNVSYNRGALRITQSHLIHTNHPLGAEGEPTTQRQLRVFNFTDEFDLIIAREVINCNPFEYTNGEKKWLQVVENLKKDDRLTNLTPRLIKKRIRFLVDKFLAVTHGKPPPTTEDELGNILYDLDKTRKDTLDNPPGRGRRRKGPGRPRKRRNLSPYLDEEIGNEEDLAEEPTSSSSPGRKRGRPTASSSSPQTLSTDISAFLTFLQKKDEQDRKLRQQEIDLRREELSLHKREVDMQKQRFEIDKLERKAHLDLINTQMRALENTSASLKPQTIAKESTGPVEYTIVVDNNNQVYETVPGLSVT